jgi:hypothetical protein
MTSTKSQIAVDTAGVALALSSAARADAATRHSGGSDFALGQTPSLAFRGNATRRPSVEEVSPPPSAGLVNSP